MRVMAWLLRQMLGRRLPYTAGTLSLAGLHGALRIHRDRWGVPMIEADHEHDAWFALGFCQGQDRGFQLELVLRVQRGTVAELIGAEGVPLDRVSRQIGFHHAALAQEPLLAAEIHEQLTAFARGIVAGMLHGARRLPPELALLRAQPSTWNVCDILGLLKLHSFLLVSNWDVELARLHVLLQDGPEALADLDPSVQERMPITSMPGATTRTGLEPLLHDLALFGEATGLGGGSNNWAIGGGRTATGRPILANDPHLAPLLPSHWYLVQVRTPEWAAAGAMFVGIPAIAVGHNGFAAWGITAGLADSTDLFREKLDASGQRVQRGEGWEDCRVRSETIRVKGGADIQEQVIVTPRGPLLAVSGEHLSLRAAWLDPAPVRGILQLHRVRSVQDFRREMAEWPLGSMNMAYADQTGVVGWQFVGRIPRRRQGRGLLPLPGWDSANGWHEEPIPFEQLPCRYAGENGIATDEFVASANAQPCPQEGELFLGHDWIDGYRHEAIVEMLATRRDWDVSSTLQMQQGALAARPWQQIRDIVLSVTPELPDARQALDLLRSWDGQLGIDSAPATVYQLLLAEMTCRLARARAPHSSDWVLGKSAVSLARVNFFIFRRTSHLVQLLRQQPPSWFAHGWKSEIEDALARTVQTLRQRFGPEVRHWGWGRVRTLILKHPLGQKAMLAGLFNLGPVPCPGDTNTIPQASVFPLDPLAPTENIASLRMVIDVGDWSRSRFVLPGGQSGNPFSPHYGNQFPLWQRGEGIALAWSPEEVRQATTQTLILESASKR